MKRKIKMVTVMILCIIVTTMSISSCGLLYYAFDRYTGDHEDLYTVAVNNIFGIYGDTSNGEISYNPEISVVETDSYGRTLFFYNECYGKGDRFDMAFVIMQKSEKGYVYYYQDDCYLPFFDTSDYFWNGTANGEDYKKAVELADDIIESLKEKNDWNQEFDSGKCTKTKISSRKPEGELNVREWNLEDQIYSYAKANGYQGNDDSAVRSIRYCNSDSTGKELYYVGCMTADEDENGEKIYGYYTYAVIVDKTSTKVPVIGEIFKTPVLGENAIVEIKDPTTCYELVMELKKQNNWK